MELRAFDDYKVDEASQRVLVALDEHGPSLASELADLADLDDPQSVRYRISNHIGPDGAGLVEPAGKRVVSGGEATVYKLSERGEGAIEAAPSEFAQPSDPAAYRDEIDTLNDTMESLQQRVDKQAERIDNRPTYKTVERTQDQMEKMVEQAEKQAERSWNAAEAASRRKEAVGDRVDDIGTRVDELREEVEDQQDRITDDIDDLETRVDEIAERQEALDERLLDVERTQSEGLLRRLLPF